MKQETASRIVGLLEFITAGACLAGLYSAGQVGQWGTALFAGTTLVFVALERIVRTERDQLLLAETSGDAAT